MPDWTMTRLDDVEDMFGGRWPGAMRSLTGPLGCEQVAITHRTMPRGSGGRGGYGHRHRTQEEVYFVLRGTLTFKLGHEEVQAPAGTAICVPPQVARSVDNDRDEEAELVIVSVRVDDPHADAEIVEGFWAEG